MENNKKELEVQGRRRMTWAQTMMPVLMEIRSEFSKTQPLKGIRISACMHITKETGVLIETLHSAGAKVILCASNPLSTQNDVAAALRKTGIEVFGRREMNEKEYFQSIQACVKFMPHVVIDDGADLTVALIEGNPEYYRFVIGGQEETTTGVIRLRAMYKENLLKFPVIAVNDTPTKRLMDNVLGTGQSTLDALMRSTNILIAGKIFVVSGFGHCGRGIAMRARGMGANVIIVEPDSVKCLSAHYEGYSVMNMQEASKIGDVFVTATGDCDAIDGRHFLNMKEGAILSNSGHFNVEINLKELQKITVKTQVIDEGVLRYNLKNGKGIIVLAEGRLVNLALAEGHPSSIMDLSFANQALVTKYLVEKGKNLKKEVYQVPNEIDLKVANMKLSTLGIKIEKLTAKQIEYLKSWQLGT